MSEGNGKIKVLMFVDRCRVGGIQILLNNLFDVFSSIGVECELLLLDDGEHYDLEDQIRNKGIQIYKLNGIWLRNPKDFISYRKAVAKFFQDHHDYAAVHVNSGTKNYYILECAKKWNIPVRIAHSHNTGFQTNSKVQKIIGDLFKVSMKKNANIYLACSDLAGKWMFGNSRFINLPNGIDLERYKYNEKSRLRIRKELGIEGNIVIGNVGRFAPQKNHLFLIDIFKEIHKINSNTILVLAGIGDLMEDTKNKVISLGLENSVLFLGFRNDISDLTQAMDLFLMPSLYEGFPVTAVEAQASGLPCVFSDSITRDIKILNEVIYLSLELSAKEWATKTLSVINTTRRDECYSLLKKGGYDIKDMAYRLKRLYGGTK